MFFDLENHLSQFPHSAVQMVEGRLAGIWMQGNNYKAVNGYYGEYPSSYLNRVLSLFPGTSPILHLFSGSINRPGEWTCDIQKTQWGPDIICKAEEVDKHIEEEHFQLVLADPPYSKRHAEEYGTKMPNIPKVMRSVYEIVKPGGMLVWLCTKPPIYLKKQWNLAGIVGFHCGTNRDFRAVIFLERQ